MNEAGQRYKTIIFAHCRADLFQDDEYMYIYYMEPEQLQSKLNKEALNIKNLPKNSAVGEVTLTRLYREAQDKEFKIAHQNIGRFIFTHVQPLDIESKHTPVVNSKDII